MFPLGSETELTLWVSGAHTVLPGGARRAHQSTALLEAGRGLSLQAAPGHERQH